ncbi:MAG TPA: hypothetical protein VF883_25445, partial [Thermoanaerobaculia bacterium]
VEPAKYLAWLDELFRAAALRPHLHRLLVRWLGRTPKPTDAEVTWVETRLRDSATCFEILERLHGNGAWVPALFPTVGLLLESGEEQAMNGALTFLGTIADEAQEILVPFLSTYLNAGKEWRQRILWVLNRIRSWRDPAAVELFEEIVTLDDVSLGHFFDFRDMARIHPVSFARIARTLLVKATDTAYAERGPGSASFSRAFHAFEQTDFADAIRDLAAAAPSVYLDAILPWFLDVVDKTGGTHDDRWFRHDAFAFAWRSGFDRTTTRLIHAIVQALISEAGADDERFRTRVAALAASDVDSVQMVVASVFAALPDRANDAIDFLLRDPRRLELGDLHERTRKLIASAVPHASDASVAILESAVLAYREAYRPRNVQDLRGDGKYQYLLLAAFPRARLSAVGRRRLDELSRKFPKIDTSIQPPRALVTMRSERSPITPDRAARLSDDHWLRAIAKYRQMSDPMSASPRQLAESLKTEAKANPRRFAALFDRLPEDTAQVYVAALVYALGEERGQLPPRLFDNVLRFAKHAESDLRRPIAWMLQKHPEDVQDEILDVLEEWVRDPTLDHPHDATSLDYLNTDRGAAFLAAMYALRVRDTAESRARRWTLIDYVITAGPVFLRAAAIEELRYELFVDDTPVSSLFTRLWRYLFQWRNRVVRNSRRAMSTFRASVDEGPAVRSAAYADDFLRLALANEGACALDEIALMLRDPAGVSERGASLAAMAAVSPKALSWWNLRRARRMVRATLRTGNVKERSAVAKIAAHNFDGPAARYVIEVLRPLLRDPSADVRAEIAVVFVEAPQRLVREQTFLRVYAGSPAITGAELHFGDFLLDHLATDSRLGLDLVEAALPHLAGTQFQHGDDIIRYVLRVASSTHTDAALQRRAMDVFDAADAQFGRYSASLLAEWDRP